MAELFDISPVTYAVYEATTVSARARRILEGEAMSPGVEADIKREMERLGSTSGPWRRREGQSTGRPGCALAASRSRSTAMRVAYAGRGGT